MKSNAPWSVKGIERDAREAAKEAARREGMTVGEWLNQMIYSHGQERASSGGDVEGLKLRDIVTAIEHLRNRIVEAEKKSSDSVSSLSRNVGGVVERVQRLERIKPQEGTYQDLAERLEKLESSGGDRNRIDALKALEKAVSQVAVQFTSAQRTTLHRLDSAEEQLQEFAERIDRVGLHGEPADIQSLKTTIEGLADRVARAEKVASEAAALRDAASSSVDPEFVEQTGAKLRVLGDEIKRGGDQIRAFEGAIAKLSDQIEAAEKRSAEGVQKVAETVAEVREQALREDTGDVAGEMEAKLAATRQETEERLSALQRSFNEMNERMQRLSEAAVSAPSPAPTPEPQSAGDDEEAPDIGEARDRETQSAVDDIEEAVAALEAESDAEEGPFAFPEDDLEAEADGEDDEDALEDFSFQLDDEAEEDAAPQQTEKAEADEVEDVRSRLDKVRSALSDEGAAEAAETDQPGDTDDDIDAILGSLEDDVVSFGDEDDEDEQAPGTASLAPASDVESDADEEPGAAEASIEELEEPETTSPEPEEAKEDYLASARRRAKEAAESRAEEAKRPTRRNLTPKQRAILAARARQKQLTAEAREAEEDDEDDVGALRRARPIDTEADETETEDDSPGGRFAKITSALSAARSRLGRGKSEKDSSPASDETQDVDSLTTGETDAAALRNGDRAALETLKATSSTRPVTLALGVAILLAIAALAFLMKDFIFPSDESGQSTPAVSQPMETPAETPTQPGPATGEQAEESGLPSVPEAPTVDPEALYIDAMSDLSAAENEAAAMSAISELRDAAALGFPPAQLQLGELYKTGQGVEQDLGQARVWFRRAATGGNVLAMHRIGVMTARGDGGPADTQGAIGWFEQAANFGLVDSQYNLGAIYHPSENGAAVQNAEQAYYWYSLAARNGDEAAEPLAAGVGASLTEAERAAVDERVSQWTAQEPDPAANAMGRN